MIIAVGTKSALKLRAVTTALEVIAKSGLGFDTFELRSGETDSGEPVQPFGFESIFRGAQTRALRARDTHAAGIGIGIENGLVEIDGQWFDPPGVVVSAGWASGRALGAFLPVPRGMVSQVKDRNSELGVIIQEAAGGGEKDPHKFLSGGMVDRESIIAQAVLMAFLPVINHPAYPT